MSKTKGRPPILAPKEAETVRRLAKTGVSAKHLAEAFKVSLPTIRSCIQRVGTYQD